MSIVRRFAFLSLSRVVAVVAIVIAVFVTAVQPVIAAKTLQRSSTSKLTLAQWSVKYLSYIGSPASSAASERVQFLEAWAKLEGAFELGNIYNPLDSEMPWHGAGRWNPQGVRAYHSLIEGFQATFSTMQQGFDRSILNALRNPASNTSTLALALAESNWTGGGPRSWLEQGYASRVGGVPMRSFGLPEPTLTLSGVLVDPLRRRLNDVCVAALHSPTAPSGDSNTSNGVFAISGLARATYRLRITDCHHVAGNSNPTYYDARAAPRYTTTQWSHATTLSSSCSELSACRDQRTSFEHPVQFGFLTPKIIWSQPKSIPSGSFLTSTQLDAKSSVRGTFSYTPTFRDVVHPGTRRITATFRPRDSKDFSRVVSTIVIDVTRVTPVISWATPSAIPEGSPLSGAQLDASSTIPGRFVYSVRSGVILGVGTRVIFVTFIPRHRDLYKVVRARTVVTVTGS